MSHKLRVVAAVVDTRNLTLYLESGETKTLPQGDERIQRIIDEATPFLLKNEVAEITIDNTSSEYAKFEAESSGLVKLFRMTKRAVAAFFKGAPAEPQVIGKVPVAQLMDAAEKQMQEVTLVETVQVPTSQLSTQETAGARSEAEQKVATAVASIMAHKAIPVTDAEFNEESTLGKNAEHTVVAVVNGVVISGVEALRPQFAHANASGNHIGMQNFLKRMAAVAEKRRHSVDDLLKFMKRGDLPIADDGCLVIYKILRSQPDGGKWVDCHTGKVPQGIGSYVCMDEKLVDHDRRNECSNGLHVARRQYLNNFSGNIMVLAKVAPEDVIAVPSYDANKMRVCGYHILFQLTDSDAALLRANKPMTENHEAARMLTKALRGDHVGKIEEVRIHGQNGQNVKVTPLMSNGQAKLETSVKTLVSADVATTQALGDPGEDDEAIHLGAAVIDPTKVAEKVQQAKSGTKPSAESEKPAAGHPGGSARQERAKVLLERIREAELDMDGITAAQELVVFKKAAKVSWTSLGLTEAEVAFVLQRAGVTPASAGTKKAKPVRQGKYKAVKPVPAKKAAPVKKTPVKKVVKAVDKTVDIGITRKELNPVDNSVKSGPSEKIGKLMLVVAKHNSGKTADLVNAKAAAIEIANIKKRAKKSYQLLGVTAGGEELVKTLVGK